MRYGSNTIVLRGDYNEYHDTVVKIGGKYITRLDGGAGWLLPIKAQRKAQKLVEWSKEVDAYQEEIESADESESEIMPSDEEEGEEIPPRIPLRRKEPQAPPRTPPPQRTPPRVSPRAPLPRDEDVARKVDKLRDEVYQLKKRIMALEVIRHNPPSIRYQHATHVNYEDSDGDSLGED